MGVDRYARFVEWKINKPGPAYAGEMDKCKGAGEGWGVKVCVCEGVGGGGAGSGRGDWGGGEHE